MQLMIPAVRLVVQPAVALLAGRLRALPARRAPGCASSGWPVALLELLGLPGLLVAAL
jgi:hypothetical protein